MSGIGQGVRLALQLPARGAGLTSGEAQRTIVQGSPCAPPHQPIPDAPIPATAPALANGVEGAGGLYRQGPRAATSNVVNRVSGAFSTAGCEGSSESVATLAYFAPEHCAATRVYTHVFGVHLDVGIRDDVVDFPHHPLNREVPTADTLQMVRLLLRQKRPFVLDIPHFDPMSLKGTYRKGGTALL